MSIHYLHKIYCTIGPIGTLILIVNHDQRMIFITLGLIFEDFFALHLFFHEGFVNNC